MLLTLLATGIMAQPFVAMSAPNGPVFYSTATVRPIERDSKTRVYDRNPFTHVVSIPATSDPSTIRFEKVKATRVFTRVKSTTGDQRARRARLTTSPAAIPVRVAPQETTARAIAVLNARFPWLAG